MNYFFTLIVLIFVISVNTGISQTEPASNDTLHKVVPVSTNVDLGIIVPPSCFEPSTAFNGYLCIGNASAIMMQKIDNVSYLQATRDMNDNFFISNGFIFISMFDLKSDHGVKGKVYKLSYVHNKQEYVRYMVFAGDLATTIWLNITYPKIVEELMELEVLKSLQTLTLNPAVNEK
jgi:hypothetical protein